MGNSTGNCFYVIGKALSAVIQATIENCYPVVALIAEIETVRVFYQSRTETESDSAFEISEIESNGNN